LPYLEPPPFPAPVIVEKDVGGLVADYQARTEQYRREGREVRLHECRSACTLALSLPNVCVYPTSVLKFHKAYDWNTKARDEGVSAQIFSAYPAAVQARLGGLIRDYRVLTGSELIALGVRDCREDQILEARAPSRPASAPAAPNLMASLLGVFAPHPAPVASETTASIPATPSFSVAWTAEAPLPPPRPKDLEAAPPVAVAAWENAPTPPARPRDPGVLVNALVARAPNLPPLISGAQPVLPYGTLSYAGFGR